MHAVYILALVTLLAAVAFGVWLLVSTKRNQSTGGNTSGIGGPADPMSGTTYDPIRSGAEIRASLDAATARKVAQGG